MRREIGLPVAFGGEVSANGTRMVISESVGNASRALNGLVVRAGHGLGGKALGGARIAAVADYLSEPSITHEYDHAVAAERLRSIVVVPVVVNGTVRAMLYGALRVPAELGSSVLRGVREIARRVEFDIAVSDEVARQLRTLEAARITDAARSLPADPDRAAVSAAYAELRALARETDDNDLRLRLARISHGLTGGQVSTRSRVLSPREVDVLSLVAVGYTNKEIADRLGIEAETVKSYLRSIMHRLSAHTRTQAVALARTIGELP